MASGVDDVTMANLEGEKSNGRKDKHVQTETSGCGMIFKFMGKCVPLKSGNSEQDAEGKRNTSSGQLVAAVASSSKNSKAVTAASTSNKNDELKIASELRKFSFDELKMATGNFRPDYIIGEGGFARVLKGWIGEKGTGRPHPVAVKILDHEGLQGHKEWLAEITYLGELHHPNLVNLIGYCIEDAQRLLVYEFMARGSLENHLFRRNYSLIWSVRLKIMLGAAQGLAFLHEEAAKPVIFRDFKTSNVLLDEDYNAKLSDFGFAKDGPVGDSTHVSTRILGTQGYAAPEYFMTGHLSTKSDVYSFGIVLLEMLTGRKAIDRSRPNGERNLVEWCRPHIGDGKNFFQLMDPRLQGIYSMKGARKALVLAARCLQGDPKARPQMSEVVAKLTPLLYLNDLASITPAYQAMERSRNVQESSRNIQRTQSGSSRTPSSMVAMESSRNVHRTQSGSSRTSSRNVHRTQSGSSRTPSRMVAMENSRNVQGTQSGSSRSPSRMVAMESSGNVQRIQYGSPRTPSRMVAMESSRNVQRTQYGSPRTPSRTPSRTPPRTPNGQQASPFRAYPSPCQSPVPYGGYR